MILRAARGTQEIFSKSYVFKKLPPCSVVLFFLPPSATACLLALPATQDELIRHYTLSETDLSIIRQHRKPANRLGFAVQLCYMRHPGVILEIDQEPFAPLLRMVATQLKVTPECWAEYGQRAETRREHLLELQSNFSFQTFTTRHYRASIQMLGRVGPANR